MRQQRQQPQGVVLVVLLVLAAAAAAVATAGTSTRVQADGHVTTAGTPTAAAAATAVPEYVLVHSGRRVYTVATNSSRLGLSLVDSPDGPTVAHSEAPLLRAGDVLVAANGESLFRPHADTNSVIDRIRALGRPISLTLMRGSFESGARPLSWSPRVMLYPNFMTPWEADYLIHATQAARSFKPNATFNSVYFPYQQIYNDALLAEIERRIAVVTASPTHVDEEPMCTHRILASTDPDNVQDVHLDTVNKPATSVTVLAYLEDVETGGETVWPCTGITHDDGTPAAAVCEAAYNTGLRWFDGERSVFDGEVHWQGKDQGQLPPPTPEALRLRALFHHACVNDTMRALKTKPRKGSAVMFHHYDLGGKEDALSWHAGCRVRNGTKWTMQKFKELPRMHRRGKAAPTAKAA